MAKQSTVFISYRRTNTWTAQAVYQYLDAHGYDVFFDVDSIRTGDWLETILSQIRARAHFIIILTPSAVERFQEPNDVMWVEIETAIAEKRNIVPLMFEGFDFPSVQHALTDKLSVIPKYNSLEVPAKFFKWAMLDMCEKMLDVDVDTIIHPTPLALSNRVQEIQNLSHNTAEIDENQLRAEKLYEQGVALQKQSDYVRAIETFTEAIKIFPAYAEAYYRRGDCYSNLGNSKKSLIDYHYAVNSNVQHPKIHIMRAMLFHELDQLGQALIEATLAVDKNNRDPEAYFIRGFVKMAFKDYEHAVEDYSKAINLNTDYTEAHFNRALSKSRLDDYEGAIEDYTQAINLNSQDAFAYNNRGYAKSKQDDFIGAIEDYERAIKLKSDYKVALKNLDIARRKLAET